MKLAQKFVFFFCAFFFCYLCGFLKENLISSSCYLFLNSKSDLSQKLIKVSCLYVPDTQKEKI